MFVVCDAVSRKKYVMKVEKQKNNLRWGNTLVRVTVLKHAAKYSERSCGQQIKLL